MEGPKKTEFQSVKIRNKSSGNFLLYVICRGRLRNLGCIFLLINKNGKITHHYEIDVRQPSEILKSIERLYMNLGGYTLCEGP